MSYYTPSIEEFHFGFEYEVKQAGIWVSDIVQANDCLSDYVGEGYRVKYLDKSDIVSLGWEYDNNAEPIPPREGEFELPYAYIFEQGLNQYVMYVYKDNTVWIEHILDCSYQGYVFKGSCRNKSELSKIMKFLNIKLTN